MTCRLEEIFQKQASYLRTLAPIYEHNEFFSHARPMPWSLNSRVYQEEFRLLAWRCTEEVFEALEYLYSNQEAVLDNRPEAKAKFHEEIADAFHFFVELCLATGITSRDVIYYYEGMCIPLEQDALSHIFRFVGCRPEDTIPQRWYMFIGRLARAMMSLKQRPWRTDDRPTDEKRFNRDMAAAFVSFIAACRRSGVNADALYNAYFAKNKINDERRDGQKL